MIINATLCYIRKNDHTLMLFRNRKPGDVHRGKWNGLGGKFEPGETPEECARREVSEECGLTATKMRLRGMLSFPQFDGVNDWFVFVFLITGFYGEIRDCPEGQLAWIKNSDLLRLPLWEGDRIFLPWLNREKIFSGKFCYRHGKLIQHYVLFY